MAGMGDPTVGVWTAFSKVLFTCESLSVDESEDRPTISDEDLYYAPEYERDLVEAVCYGGDCLVAFGSESLRTSLTVGLLKESAPRLALVLVEAEDDAYKEHLDILLSDNVSWIAQADQMVKQGVLLMLPETLLSILKQQTITPHEVDVLVLRKFEQYLQPEHEYRRVVEAFEGCASRLLCLVDALPAVRTMDDLENCLRTLRTPRKLPLRAAWAARPYSKECSPEPVLLEGDWAALEHLLAAAEDERVRDLKGILRRDGIVAAVANASRINSTHPDLLEFMSRSESQLLELRGAALLNLRQGATLVLTASVSTHAKLTRWLKRRGVAIASLLHHEEWSPEEGIVVATLADLPTVQRYSWETIVLFDLPLGSSCDGLLHKTDRRFALCTQPQWNQWQNTLLVHDALQDLVQRVNQ